MSTNYIFSQSKRCLKVLKNDEVSRSEGHRHDEDLPTLPTSTGDMTARRLPSDDGALFSRSPLRFAFHIFSTKPRFRYWNCPGPASIAHCTEMHCLLRLPSFYFQSAFMFTLFVFPTFAKASPKPVLLFVHSNICNVMQIDCMLQFVNLENSSYVLRRTHTIWRTTHTG